MPRIVPAEGPKNCNIAIIGEAPGSTEDRVGRPFVGRAGMLLNELLENAGILRSQCYITNVVKERPPSDDMTRFITIKNSNNITMTDEYKQYEAMLYEEMKDVTANVVVALGKHALFATTRKYGILKQRGGVLHAVEKMNGRKVIPTIHPAAVLHQSKWDSSVSSGRGGVYLWRYFIELDLAKISRHSMSPSFSGLNRNIYFPRTVNEAILYLKEANTLPYVGFDIEVMKGEVSCFAISKSANDAMCIPLTKDGNHYFTPDEEALIWKHLAALLENEDVMKLGQNIIFDVSFMFERLGIKARNFGDTMIAQGITTPDFPKGLDFITSVYTDEPYYKDEGKKWMNFGGSTEQEFWQYNAKDAMMCSECYPKLMLELKSLRNEETYKTHIRLIEPCIFMQARGMRVDVEGLNAEAARAEAEKAELSAKLNELAGEEINPDSPKQLMNLFYVKLGLPPYLKGGKMTTDRNALKRLVRKGVEEAAIVQKIRKISKLHGTYLTMKLRDGRMRSAYNPVGAADSGRLSSSQDIFGYGGNLQTLPYSIRKYVIADEGMAIYSLDLKQAENRIIAYIAPEPTLISAFENGEDIHSKTAGLILNKPASEISNEEGSCAIGDGTHSERFWGKKANHGLNYGLGYRKFALENEIPEVEAKLIVQGYHAAYSGIRTYHNWVREALRDNGRKLTNPFGRTRIFLEQWGDKLFDEAYNFIPQSTVADVINQRGMIYVYYNDKFKQVELMNQLHDSIVFQIPISIGWEKHAEIINDIVNNLETPITFRGTTFNIPVAVEVGSNLGQLIEVNRGNNVEEWAANIEAAYTTTPTDKEEEEEDERDEDE